nr:hypothetical protein [uncultured Duganella sp.]
MKQLHAPAKFAFALILTAAAVTGCKKQDPVTPEATAPAPVAAPAPAPDATTPPAPGATTPPADTTTPPATTTPETTPPAK